MKDFLKNELKKILGTCAYTLILFAIFSNAHAIEVQGYLNTGIWYLKNDLADNPNYTPDDNYGESYVQDDFAMFNANLTMDVLHMNDPSSNTDISMHLKGRALYDLLDNPYSLAPYDDYRYELDETNVQFGMKSMDIWLGRHTIYETGGIGVDGVTAIFKTSESMDAGIFGGLGNDPRTLTGYIGPTYKTALFNADFYTGGIFAKKHTETFKMDAGVNTLIYKGSVDRSNFFTQMLWTATPSWMFSLLADVGFMGFKGLQRGMLGVTTKITPKLTNRFYSSQFRSLLFTESDASAIPIPGLNPGFIVGTNVDTSEYYSARDEIQIRFDKNYIFTGFEFARRTYDDQNRLKYLLGYFDPEIFESEFDFRIQADIIKNYVSFNSAVDMILGRDFSNEKFRAEVGATFFANERDLFEDGVFINSKGQIEKETTARANFQFNATHNLSMFLNYAYYKETDVYDLDQPVHTHEIYFSSNIRF